MKVRDVLFFATIENSNIERGGTSITFASTKFPIPNFAEVLVFSDNKTKFLHQGKTITRKDASGLLRGYALKPIPAGADKGTKALVEIFCTPFLEGLWIRVTGHATLSNPVYEVTVDREKVDQMRGDMDLPITGIVPWRLLIDATIIELHAWPYFKGRQVAPWERIDP